MLKWTCQGDLCLKVMTHGLACAALTPPWLLQERRTFAKGETLEGRLEKLYADLGGLLAGSAGSMLTSRDALHGHPDSAGSSASSTARLDAALAATAAACAATGAAVDPVAASEIKQLRQQQMAELQVCCPQGGTRFCAA